ncbi:MAG: hypothetical protein RIT45_59 [Pseudomonadota bacterium]|jgi:outer membrane protein TolC
MRRYSTIAALFVLAGLLGERAAFAGELERAHPEADGAHDHDQAPQAVDFATVIGAVPARADLELARRAATAGSGHLAAVGAAGTWLLQAYPSVRLAPDLGAELQGGVQKNIPMEDLAGGRRAALRAEAAVLRARVDTDMLSARLDAARAFFALWTAAEIQRLLLAELKAAEATVEVARRARGVGAGSAHDVAEAEAVHAELQSRAVEIEHALHHAGIELARATGLPFARSLRARGPLPEPPLPKGPALAAALERARQSPPVRLAALERDAARARAAEARAGRGSWLQVGGWAELGTPGDATFRLTLGWQTGSRSQNAREEAAAAREDAAHQAQVARLRRDAEATLLDASHEVHHSARALELLRTRWLPAAERRLALRKAALAAGAGRRVEVVAAERALLQARIEEVRLQAAARWAAVQLWLLLRRAEEEPR